MPPLCMLTVQLFTSTPNPLEPSPPGLPLPYALLPFPPSPPAPNIWPPEPTSICTTAEPTQLPVLNATLFTPFLSEQNFLPTLIIILLPDSLLLLKPPTTVIALLFHLSFFALFLSSRPTLKQSTTIFHLLL